MENKTADFVQTLVEMRNGAVASECSNKLTEVIKAVCETGKKGKLALVIGIEPSMIVLGEVTEIQLKHDVKIIEPTTDPGVTTFFPLKDETGHPSGVISRQDPNQMALDLQAETKR